MLGHVGRDRCRRMAITQHGYTLGLVTPKFPLRVPNSEDLAFLSLFFRFSYADRNTSSLLV
jgi:hypothetical protein